MSKTEQNWIEFNDRMLRHIRTKGHKYDKYDTLSIMSDMFCIDSIIKYAIETKRSLELNDTIDESTVASIAHYAQVLIHRLQDAEDKALVTIETKEPDCEESSGNYSLGNKPVAD